MTHKTYVNPSAVMIARLRWPDGRHIIVRPMTMSKRVRIFNDEGPTITWEKRQDGK